MNWVIIDV